MGWSGTAQSEAGFFARSPEMSRSARGSAHEIRSFPLVSQRQIIASIRLRRLYPFRTIQDRESALQQAPPAHSMKMMGVALGRIRVGLEQTRKSSPVTASEEFVDGGNLIRHG